MTWVPTSWLMQGWMMPARCLRGMCSMLLDFTLIRLPIHEYIVTVPLFDKVTFNLNGRPFTIVKKGSGKKIIDITYDGKKIDGYFITHDQLREGKELVITTE